MHADERELFGHKRNNDIEILRGLAIAMVLVEHLMDMSNAPLIQAIKTHYFSAWGGVDLFFAISGLMIVRSLLEASYRATTPTRVPVLVNFWIKRVWRLWPSSWFWLFGPFLVVLIFVPEFRHGDNFRAMLASLLGGVLNIANIQQWHAQAGFGMPNVVWGQYWSLSLEEQFYLVAAPLLLWAPRRVVVAVMVGLIAWQFPMVRPSNASDIWWFIRSDAFAWGVLVALLWDSTLPKTLVEPTLLRHKRYAWVVLGVALTGIMATQLLYSVPFDVALMAILSGALVFVASFDKGYLGVGGLPGRVLSWLGSRSYTVYLTHFFVIALISLTTPLAHADRSSLLNMGEISAVVVGASLLLAELSYRFLEVSARLHGRKLAKAYLARATAALAGEVLAQPVPSVKEVA